MAPAPGVAKTNNMFLMIMVYLRKIRQLSSLDESYLFSGTTADGFGYTHGVSVARESIGTGSIYRPNIRH